MSALWKLNSINVLSKAVRKLNNFFKTSKRFCQGCTDGRCQDQLESDSHGWGISRAHWASRLPSVCAGGRSCGLCLCVSKGTAQLCLLQSCFHIEPLVWVCNCMISSALHSSSVSNLERFKRGYKTKSMEEVLRGWFTVSIFSKHVFRFKLKSDQIYLFIYHHCCFVLPDNI